MIIGTYLRNLRAQNACVLIHSIRIAFNSNQIPSSLKLAIYIYAKESIELYILNITWLLVVMKTKPVNNSICT